HVAEQWLDAGYHIGISLGCCLLGYGAESNVLMRALSQKPEEIDVAAEANPDETFKQALGYRIAASGRWLIWNKETRSFTVPKDYDTAIEDPPEPTRDVSKTTSDSPQSKTLHPGRQYWLKLMCEAQDGPKPNLERKRHSKIHEAIEELSRFWESLDGSRKLDDSGSSCVFGCTYMAMGIQLELKGESDLAASYEAEAKACFEKALRNSSQYAVRVSTNGIATNGNVEEETWSQLEQWLRNYSLCWLRETESCRSPVLEEDRWR
ncbi:hypothetical protein CDV36_016652, partial [Fusarium kuroshium]